MPSEVTLHDTDVNLSILEAILLPCLRRARDTVDCPLDPTACCTHIECGGKQLFPPKDLFSPIPRTSATSPLHISIRVGPPAGPSESAIAGASASLKRVLNCSPGTGLGSADLYDGALGRLAPEREAELPAPAAAFLRSMHCLVSATPTAALFAAIRRLIAPHARLRDLLSVNELQFFQVSSIYLAALTMAHIRSGRLDASSLTVLRDRRSAPPRAEWARAFGLGLPRPTTWPAEESAFRAAFGGGGARGQPEATRLLDLVRAAGDSLAGISLRELLLILQPISQRGPTTNPLMLGGWATPFAWFVRSNLHFAFVPTSEAVEALAGYLRSRQAHYSSLPQDGDPSAVRAAAAPTARLVEVGAGSGHLAALLNATGQLSPPLVATDPFPTGYAQAESAIYGPAVGGRLSCQVEPLDADGAIAKHRPAIVLCSFMTAGEDWTAAWRAAAVDEYVLIGDIGSGPQQYSLNRDNHGDYERELLREVSSELLDAGQAALEGSPAERAGYLVAVAYRKPRSARQRRTE